MTSIRGAITVTENTSEAILEAADELLRTIIEVNQLTIDQIIDITFSVTQDLDAVYPAVAARTMGIVDAGLFCVQEMFVKGSLPMCIRVLLHVEYLSSMRNKRQSDMRHVYLRDAMSLRPDLVAKAPYAVAIDGPSGAGKSTAAKGVAAKLGIVYIDTGAMYRSVALYCIRENVDVHDRNAVEERLDGISIDLRYNAKKHQRLFLNGEDVTEALRTQEVAEVTSIVASYPFVRGKLVALQQSLSRKRSVVMDGRDIGSTVLPNAKVKVYLDASLEERVRRRMTELKEKGLPAVQETIRKEIEVRDNRDMNRTYAPLVRVQDAMYIHSDNMTEEEIVEKIVNAVQA